MNSFLQIFLLINVFVIGMLVPIGIKHAKAHFKPEEHDAEKTHRKTSAAAHLPIATKERLLHQAEANFQTIINRSTKELEHNLSAINTVKTANIVLFNFCLPVLGFFWLSFFLPLIGISLTRVEGVPDALSICKIPHDFHCSY